MAEVDRPVMVVTRVAMRMMAMVSPVGHTETKVMLSVVPTFFAPLMSGNIFTDRCYVT